MEYGDETAGTHSFPTVERMGKEREELRVGEQRDGKRRIGFYFLTCQSEL